MGTHVLRIPRFAAPAVLAAAFAMTGCMHEAPAPLATAVVRPQAAPVPAAPAAPKPERPKLSIGSQLAKAMAPEGMPMEYKGVKLISPFGNNRRRHIHAGVDLKAPHGTPVHATAPGVVTFSGREGAYGDIVVVKHDGGYSTAYAHLSTRKRAVGDMVAKGDLVGHVGRSGNATTPHLHYEVRREGKPVDPAPFIGLREREARNR